MIRKTILHHYDPIVSCESTRWIFIHLVPVPHFNIVSYQTTSNRWSKDILSDLNTFTNRWCSHLTLICNPILRDLTSELVSLRPSLTNHDPSTKLPRQSKILQSRICFQLQWMKKSNCQSISYFMLKPVYNQESISWAGRSSQGILHIGSPSQISC